MKIAVWNEKGGVGKTTTVVTLARLWREYSPLIIDADPQVNTQMYLRALQGADGQGATIHAMHGARVGAALEETRAARVLVDCPPEAMTADAIMPHVDCVIVPCACEFAPMRAAVKSLESLKRRHPQLRARLLLTLFSPLPISRRVRDDLRAEYGSGIFDTVIARNRAVLDSSALGATVFDLDEEKQTARQYRALGKEIDAWLKTT